MKKFNIAVVGATGNVGREVLSLLAERKFPVGQVFAVASDKSMGKQISFGEDAVLDLTPLEQLNFAALDFIFACAGSEISKQLAEKAKQHKVVIIDKSSYFRLNEAVPLIVPAVNIEKVVPNTRIIANPNCCVIPLVTALYPLSRIAKIKSLVVSTYQSVSGAGKKAMDELYELTKAKYLFQENTPRVFSQNIAFNVIPQIDKLDDSGYTGEELKIMAETKKILGNDIIIDVTSVRVPVFIGHCLSVNIEFASPIDAKLAEEILYEDESITLIPGDATIPYITPAEVAGEDSVFVSRVRQNLENPSKLTMWIACDNLRKGAALNALEIVECLIK